MNMEKFCECEKVTGVARDGKPTCTQCGGIDAYKSSTLRNKKQNNTLEIITGWTIKDKIEGSSTDELKNSREDRKYVAVDDMKKELKKLLDEYPYYTNPQELLLKIFRLREKLTHK